VRFKTLLDKGYSIRRAARKFNIPYSSAQYFIDKPDRQVKVPGTPSKISNKQVQEIIKKFISYYDYRVLSLKQIRE
jgi:transposase